MKPENTISLEDRQSECKPLVLVVDDDESHQKLFGLLADNLGITAHMASSCSQAIEALRTFSFDLVLMDYRMPEVDGCICTQRIRALTNLRSDVAIIAVTGDVSAGTREKCLEAGMDDFLAKPFTLEELHEKLCLWLKKKAE